MRHSAIRSGVLVLTGMLLMGCAPWYAQDKDTTAMRDGRINVGVLVTGNCGVIKLPVEDNECEGVRKTDGVACGQPGDTLVWTPRTRDTKIRVIQFIGVSPCTAPPVEDPLTGAWSCGIAGTMNETSQTKEFELFAYDLTVARDGKKCPKYDPYFIRSNR